MLNSVDIEVSSASYTADDGSVVPVKEISYNKDEEKVIINFLQNLPPGKQDIVFSLKFLLSSTINHFA